MDWNNYETMVKATGTKDGQFIPFVICLLGLVGEAGELFIAETPERACDEIGDLLWYTGALFLNMGVSIPEAMALELAPLPELPIELLQQAPLLVVANVAETMKKIAWHASETDILPFMMAVVATLRATAARFDTTLEAVAQANVDKLAARYPNGFVVGGGIR